MADFKHSDHYKELDPHRGVFVMDQNLGAENIRSFRTVLLEICDRDHLTLYMDMSNVENLSSWGIGVIALAARKLRENGGVLLIRGASENLARILSYSRMDMIVDVSPEPHPSK